ncbi:hypothetical protein HPB52_007648 [Rhipicephalus sanguineus]|uniref:Fibronectin type-III domain-containing protein n=1 Tax=Rhipicephalus sanguineus TaxID=34632 RepID=A0A9D4SQ33_RHISA|nr:hypothetical protein HPB52_007648 [Rhipicephalus sanguineus]
MGRIRTWRRPLPVAPLAWTGFYVFFCCSTLAVAQLPDTCTELPELNVTRNGSTIIFHRARPASSSQVNETSCICYPVLRDEQDFENFTCDNATSSHRTCDALPADQDNSVEVDISEQISSGESSICHFSNCGKKNCSIYDAPAKPEDLRVTTIETTSATIEWTEPRVKNGVLDGYIIKVCRRNEPVENKCTGAPTLHIMINDSSTTSYKLGRSRSVD